MINLLIALYANEATSPFNVTAYRAEHMRQLAAQSDRPFLRQQRLAC
jgi:hypothetical protein